MRKFIFSSLVMIFIGSYIPTSFACGSNTPAQLEARAKDFFNRWDVNHDQVLQVEEFVAGDGYTLGSGANESSWVQLFKDKLPLVETFQNADTDHSGGFSYQEWIVIRPPQKFMLRDGC